MPTTLYFHDALNALAGTFPTGEQSARTPTAGTTPPAFAVRTMDTTPGVLQTSLAATTLNVVETQWIFMTMFVSPPLNGAQSVGGTSVTVYAADKRSNANSGLVAGTFDVYVWRPSDGSLVGTIRDRASFGGYLGAVTNYTSEEVTGYVDSTSIGSVSASNGDVIIFEAWMAGAQTSTMAYTVTYYYDGTDTTTTAEDTIVSSMASRVILNSTNTFQSVSAADVRRKMMAYGLYASSS
jgi:hypothetical protein